MTRISPIPILAIALTMVFASDARSQSAPTSNEIRKAARERGNTTCKVFDVILGTNVDRPCRPTGTETRSKPRTSQIKMAAINPTVQKVQKQLMRLRCNPGPADGIWGSQTNSAWQSFLRQNRVTGISPRNATNFDFILRTVTRSDVVKCGSSKSPNIWTQSRILSDSTWKHKPGVWYRDDQGRYCKRLNFGKWCQTKTPKNH